MWFFEIDITNLLDRKYQNRFEVGIIKTWYTLSWEKETKPYSVGKSKLRKKRKQKKVLVILMAWEVWGVLDVLNYLL